MIDSFEWCNRIHVKKSTPLHIRTIFFFFRNFCVSKGTTKQLQNQQTTRAMLSITNLECFVLYTYQVFTTSMFSNKMHSRWMTYFHAKTIETLKKLWLICSQFANINITIRMKLKLKLIRYMHSQNKIQTTFFFVHTKPFPKCSNLRGWASKSRKW